MIIDDIRNAGKYAGLGAGVAEVLAYLAEHGRELAGREPGRYEINGDDLYVMVQRYESRPRAVSKWEAHRRYIDIQYVAEGAEMMGWADIAGMKVAKEYDPEGDYMLLEGPGSMLNCGKGTFVVLGPDDAHMPGVCAGAPQQMVKLVFKVKVSK